MFYTAPRPASAPEVAAGIRSPADGARRTVVAVVATRYRQRSTLSARISGEIERERDVPHPRRDATSQFTPAGGEQGGIRREKKKYIKPMPRKESLTASATTSARSARRGLNVRGGVRGETNVTRKKKKNRCVPPRPCCN